MKVMPGDSSNEFNGRTDRGITPLLVGTFVAFLLGTITGRGQTSSLEVSLTSVSPPVVRVEGSVANATTSWSFRNVYAGELGLARRIRNLTLRDSIGGAVNTRILSDGEYEAALPASRFVYEIALDPPDSSASSSHVSWISSDSGFLMFGDLVPLALQKRKAEKCALSLKLPPGWIAHSTLNESPVGQVVVSDLANSVFFVGRSLREHLYHIGPLEFSLVVSSSWSFSDDDLGRLAEIILRRHTQTFGRGPGARSMLMLSPFPGSESAERWSSETRGNTVVFVSGSSPSRLAALARLGVPLAHELFHLWVPNALGLEGDYDWFYEGFTQYEALRSALSLDLLTFSDFLRALSNALGAYARSPDRDTISLIEASRRRWSTNSGLVYGKGVLVAFLYDLTLRHRSKSKESIEEIYRELFRRHDAKESLLDGNAETLAVLSRKGSMREFGERNIEGAAPISLESELSHFGFRVETVGPSYVLSVSEKLNREQRDMLHKFGYN